MKLYDIRDSEINNAIRRLIGDFAGVTYLSETGEVDHESHIAQVLEMDDGVLFSGGYDEYMPSQCMHLVDGQVVIDERKREIHVVDDGIVRAVIHKADDVQRRILERYLGYGTEEGKRHVEMHTAVFKSSRDDMNNVNRREKEMEAKRGR